MNCNFSGLLSIAKISVNITHGEYVAALGKSGNGKPTLLNQIAGQERPTSGVFQVADTA
ncbi:MAG: ATP-binding cassette domain-containing protein, partial [Burkholderiaceae bacterium]|nr:ATP-binding cassette domain-containing protein [Burkholderiaceae bacterium]